MMTKHVVLISKLPARAEGKDDLPWADGKLSASEMLTVLSGLLDPFVEMMASKAEVNL